jgi:hypothetical protein
MESQNTILIDDSPEKCVCNNSGNCLFLETWNPLDTSDDFLSFVVLLLGYSICTRTVVGDNSRIL